jgi:hypothetical protein
MCICHVSVRFNDLEWARVHCFWVGFDMWRIGTELFTLCYIMSKWRVFWRPHNPAFRLSNLTREKLRTGSETLAWEMHDSWSSLCISDVNIRFKCQCIVTIILGYQWAAYSNLVLIFFKWKSFSEVIGPDFLLESIDWYKLKWVFWFVSGVGLIDEPAMWLWECFVSWYHVGKSWRQFVVFTLFQSSPNNKPTEQI